jgi:RNA polymerase sigma factor (sigma-70 family)
MSARTSHDSEFEAFVHDARMRLRRALVSAVGIDNVDDAVSGALEWACTHRHQLQSMDNPMGYLFRVGQSSVRKRRRVRLVPDESVTLPEVEPGLIPALRSLTPRDRVAVWLAHGCGWTHAEIAQALGVKRTTASTHVSRGMAVLRRRLGVKDGIVD